MVCKAVEYINAGDAFQVVPSHRISVPFRLPPLALYRSLRRLNPSPFLFFFDFGGYSIVVSSPDILFRLRRSETRLVGNEFVSTCRFQLSPFLYTQTTLSHLITFSHTPPLS